MNKKIENILYGILRIMLLFISISIAIYICKNRVWYIIGFAGVLLCSVLDYLDGSIIHTPMKNGKDTWIELGSAIYLMTVFIYIHGIISNFV